jgi:uncharacterized protein (DUF362 family)
VLGASACLPHVSGEWGGCQDPLDEPDGGGIEVPAPRSHRVVEVVANQAVDPDSLAIRAELLPGLLAAGLAALTGEAAPAAAWRAVLTDLQPGQRVGLKVNALNARVPSSPHLVAALVASLRSEAGLTEQEVFVWDRSVRELSRAGFDPGQLGCALQGTHASSSDPTGPGYDAQTVCLSGRQIRLSRVLVGGLEHLINVAVMKNHLAAGFTGALKNHYGSFANPGDFHAGCEQHVARLNALPEITRVSRLHVLDALVGVCAGDTADPPDCAPGRILLAFDPVALDQRGLELRDAARALKGAPPGPPAAYLELAAALGLGTRDYELVTIA